MSSGPPHASPDVIALEFTANKFRQLILPSNNNPCKSIA